VNLITDSLLNSYKEAQKLTLHKHLNALERKAKRVPLDFYTTTSAVYSSSIEGNFLDFDTFTKYKLSEIKAKGKSYNEIENLRLAYEFAQQNDLTEKNLLKAHKIATKHLIENKNYQGQYRNVGVFVVKNGIPVFTGCPTEQLSTEMARLFEDITILLDKEQNLTDSFYYASMLHLCLVQIHPFADGNGRMARLLEKWFLAETIGGRAWLIPSEKLYHKRINQYYKNVHIGATYDTILYQNALPFLLMLPMALKIHN
jgi:filamentation induced by cAMP protein fic